MKIGASALRKRSTRPYEQIVIEGVTPDHGRFPVKALAGQSLVVDATVLRHGIDPLRVAARVRRPRSTSVREYPMKPISGEPDRFRVEFLLDAAGRFTCTIAAWTDQFSAWVERLRVRGDSAEREALVTEGLALIERAAASVKGETKKEIVAVQQQASELASDVAGLTALVSNQRVLDLIGRHALRDDEVRNETDLEIMADRPIAGAGSWVSLPIEAGLPAAEGRLAGLHEQGFDVIHLGGSLPGGSDTEPLDRFVRAANALGLEVAVDLEGERTRHLDFDTSDWKRLWPEFRDVVRFWISHGIKIFRVESPHLRPLGFWSWLVEETHLEAPEVLFLAGETPRLSFARALGARGFTQTAVSVRHILEKRPPSTDIRPNVWVGGGENRAALLLAATLSASWTVTDPPAHLRAWLSNLNGLRKANPCLQQSGSCKFIETDDEQVVAYVRATPDRSNAVIVVVNLDPAVPRSSIIRVPAAEVGMNPGAGFEVVDALTGRSFAWSDAAHVRIDPDEGEPAHVFTIRGR